MLTNEVGWIKKQKQKEKKNITILQPLGTDRSAYHYNTIQYNTIGMEAHQMVLQKL